MCEECIHACVMRRSVNTSVRVFISHTVTSFTPVLEHTGAELNRHTDLPLYCLEPGLQPGDKPVTNLLLNFDIWGQKLVEFESHLGLIQIMYIYPRFWYKKSNFSQMKW